LAGRFEYNEFCSVVKLAAMTNMQNSVIYSQLPALAPLQLWKPCGPKVLQLFAIAALNRGTIGY